MEALAKSEAEGGDSLHTATLAENLATTLRDLASDAVPGPEKRTLTVEALARTRDLAARVGDESNLERSHGNVQANPSEWNFRSLYRMPA